MYSDCFAVSIVISLLASFASFLMLLLLNPPFTHVFDDHVFCSFSSIPFYYFIYPFFHFLFVPSQETILHSVQFLSLS